MRPRNPDQLKQAMQAAGYNTVQLARRIGLSKQYVAMLMGGTRGCKPSTADAVAEALGVDVDTLFIAVLSENSYNEMEDDVTTITEEDPYLLFDEVCEITRTKPGTMRNLRTAGKGPRFFKKGRFLLCRRSEALAWMQEHEQNAE
ncbi:helix-turn-helix domain-containing protein [Streptosporangium roseum]|uniref:helix-turn-helix domain-containing protein n=1 Tax=Streptosporangium roseum TaxID=2001 RepID=UPI0004CD712F|nr:helix-turn-helix domain-containing protein [Streptosporangium roseum]